MSRNLRLRADLRPERVPTQLSLCQQRFGTTLGAVPSSTDLATCAPSLDTRTHTAIPDLRARIEATCTRLEQLPGARDVIAAQGVDLSDLVADAGRSNATASQLRTAHDALAAAIGSVSFTLADIERQALAEIVAEVTEGWGWRVSEAADHRTSAIHAEHGDRHVLAVVTAGGALEVDIAGCAGGECTPVLARLQADLAERGVELRLVSDDGHGEERGGALIQRAARAARDNGTRRDLARGAVLQAGTTARPSPPSRRRGQTARRVILDQEGH